MAKPQKAVGSDFNLQKITTSQMEAHVEASIKAKSNVAIFGRRGTGKTEIMQQQIRKSGCKEVYLNLSVLERVDLGGYPNVMSAASGSDFVSFLLPDFYKAIVAEGDSKEVVVLFDEVDKADPSLWAPLLEFIQARKMNGRTLTKLRACLLTGNLPSEGGTRPSLPLLDRCEKYMVEPSVQAWLDWAAKTGQIHPSIVAFINDNNGELFGQVDPEERYSDPSPRSWVRASNLVNSLEAQGCSTDLLNMKVAGCVGKEAGMKYNNYYEHYQHLLPLVESVFAGTPYDTAYNSLEASKKIVASMIVCSRLTSVLDSTDKKKENGKLDPKAIKNRDAAIANAGKFLSFVSRRSPENALIAVRCNVGMDRMVNNDLDDHPAFSDLIDQIRSSSSSLKEM